MLSPQTIYAVIAHGMRKKGMADLKPDAVKQAHRDPANEHHEYVVEQYNFLRETPHVLR